MNPQNKLFVVIGSVAVLATASFGAYTLFKGDESVGATIESTTSLLKNNTPSTTSSTSVSTTNNQSSMMGNSSMMSNYKDGTYSATSSYRVPHGGYNSITASITINGGKVTAVTTKNSYTDGESGMYVDSFNSSISSAIVGTSLGNVSLSRVGGASLTTQAFSDVISQVISQAS